MEIAPHVRDMEAVVHEERAGKDLSGLFMAVVLRLVETAEPYTVLENAGFLEHCHVFEKRLALVLRDELPSVEAVIGERVADTVVVACSDKRVILVELGDLVFYRRLVVVAYAGDIELISECSDHSHMSAGPERGDPSDAVIWAVGDMSAEAGARIAHRGAVLYFKALYRVGVIARPYLRRVV